VTIRSLSSGVELQSPISWSFRRRRSARLGYALFLAQMGERHPTMAKTLKGFGGGAVIEIRESHEGNAYRAVYTVRYTDVVYVLHAFQKKSRTGIATPKQVMMLIERRLKELVSEKERS
jgi:phage-related protein